jgi:hypothetical protein
MQNKPFRIQMIDCKKTGNLIEIDISKYGGNVKTALICLKYNTTCNSGVCKSERLAGKVDLSNLAARLPSPEDERIFKSVVAKWMKEFVPQNCKTFNQEMTAMSFLRDKIFKEYELRKRKT